jgi:LPS export ABC transporter protein LptC
MNGKRRWALALLAGAILVAGCRGEKESSITSVESIESPNEGMKGISLHNYHVADVRWVLQADSASVFRDRKRVEAEWVEIDFFDGDEPMSTLTADRGILLQNTDDLEARGNVRVVTTDGDLLKTEVLFWDHQRSLIHTDEYVEITRGDNVLTGVGLEADPGLNRVDLKQTVRGEVRSAPEGLLDGGTR